MHNDRFNEDDFNGCDIEKLVDNLVEVFKNMPPRYLPLSEDLSCPHCKGIIKDEIDHPEEGVVKYMCLRCSAKYYVDFRR